jgi:hypothetical protein
MNKEFRKLIEDIIEKSKKYQTCMSLDVNEEGGYVTLNLDSKYGTYLDPLEDEGAKQGLSNSQSEGADIGLLRDMNTDKVVGIRLPLLNKRLSIWHKGELKVNAGFLKEEKEIENEEH